MKVVHLCTVDLSGAGRAAMRIVKALKAYGVDATLLCLFCRLHDADTVAYCPPRSPLWFRIGKRMHLWSTAAQRRNRVFAPYNLKDGVNFLHSDCKVEMSSYVQTADIIHLHWIEQFVDLSLLFKQTRQPIVWTLHDMGAFTAICNYNYLGCSHYHNRCGKCPVLDSTNEVDLSRDIWQEKAYLFERNMCRLYIVTCSNWLANCARNSGLLKNANIRVIPNCIDTNMFRPMGHKRNGNRLSVMLGAYDATDPNKGYERLSRIVEEFAKQSDFSLEVVVVGKNSDNISFSSNISVASYGFVERETDLVNIYNKVDLLLYGSYRDNLPNMIMEAMACGVPVVAFPVGGIPDMVKHKKTGYLAESEADYICGIQYCVENWQHLHLNARAMVEDCFSTEVVASIYNDLYREIYDKKA